MSKKIIPELLEYFPLIYIDTNEYNYKNILLTINILSNILNNDIKICSFISKNTENTLLQNCFNNIVSKYLYNQGLDIGIIVNNKLNNKYLSEINYDISYFYSEKNNKLLSFCIYKNIISENKIYINLICNNYKSGLAYQLIKNLAKKFNSHNFELYADHIDLINIYKLWGFSSIKNNIKKMISNSDIILHTNQNKSINNRVLNSNNNPIYKKNINIKTSITKKYNKEL